MEWCNGHVLVLNVNEFIKPEPQLQYILSNF